VAVHGLGRGAVGVLNRQFTVIGDFVICPGASGDHLTDGAEIGAGRRIAPQLQSARGILDHADGIAAIDIAALLIPILSAGRDGTEQIQRVPMPAAGYHTISQNASGFRCTSTGTGCRYKPEAFSQLNLRITSCGRSPICSWIVCWVCGQVESQCG
jgi:hypothetical protein